MTYDWRFDLVLGSLGFLAQGIAVTVGVCLLAFVRAFPIGLVAAVARLSRFRLVRIVGQIYVDLIRSTPILIQLVWIFYALPILTGISFSLLETGVLSLGLYGGAYLAEIFRGGINSISEGQFEAGRAIGLTTPQLWRRIILPQALARMLPPIASTLITLVKEIGAAVRDRGAGADVPDAGVEHDDVPLARDLHGRLGNLLPPDLSDRARHEPSLPTPPGGLRMSRRGVRGGRGDVFHRARRSG